MLPENCKLKLTKDVIDYPIIVDESKETWPQTIAEYHKEMGGYWTLNRFLDDKNITIDDIPTELLGGKPIISLQQREYMFAYVGKQHYIDHKFETPESRHYMDTYGDEVLDDFIDADISPLRAHRMTYRENEIRLANEAIEKFEKIPENVMKVLRTMDKNPGQTEIDIMRHERFPNIDHTSATSLVFGYKIKRDERLEIPPLGTKEKDQPEIDNDGENHSF